MEISIIQERGLWPEKRIKPPGSKSVLRISNWSKSVVIDRDPDFLACLPLGGVRALRSFHSLIQSSLIQEISGHFIAANLELSVRVVIKSLTMLAREYSITLLQPGTREFHVKCLIPIRRKFQIGLRPSIRRKIGQMPELNIRI